MGDITHEMAAEIKPSGFSGAEYNKVATSAELGGITLLSTKFKVAPEAMADPNELKLERGRKTVSCGFDAETGTVVAIFQFNAEARLLKKKVLECVAEFAVLYNTPEGATEAGAVAFCRNVGSFAAYPYFRALVSQLCWNAGLVLPPLPAIASTAHIPPKDKKMEKEVVEG